MAVSHRRRSIRLVLCVIALQMMLSSSADVRGQSPPSSLPDRNTFIAEVRSRLRTDEELQSRYTYLEKRQQIRVSKLGKVQLGQTRLFEVYPSPEPSQTYRRLLAVDGVPLNPDVLKARDEARQKFLTDQAASRAQETPRDRARRERKEAEARQEQQNTIDDVFRAYEIELVGRESIDGHQSVVAALEPRSGVSTRSDIGKYFPKFRGRAWVSEHDYQVVKVEMEAVENILLGWGILGRVHKGSRMVVERRKINDEVWLPARLTFEVVGRALLVRKFSVRAVTEFSEYKRFDVATSETFKVTE
ncbi:MAG TPA: hypothetical protein VH701_11035 [Vicinamibacterales bacterium]